MKLMNLSKQRKVIVLLPLLPQQINKVDLICFFFIKQKEEIIKFKQRSIKKNNLMKPLMRLNEIQSITAIQTSL